MTTLKSTKLNLAYFSVLPGILKPIVFVSLNEFFYCKFTNDIFQIEIICLLACFAYVDQSPDGIYLSWLIVAASLIGILADSIYMLFEYAENTSFVSNLKHFYF
jgi:hypothetical protein